MGWFGWLMQLFGRGAAASSDISGVAAGDAGFARSDDSLAPVNPATGLPMVGGIGGVDVLGNPYGVDASDHTTDLISNDWTSAPMSWDDTWHSGGFDS